MPGHEQRGIGHRLLAYAEGYAIAERAQSLQVVVEESNKPARSFYKRSGFLPLEPPSGPTTRPPAPTQVDSAHELILSGCPRLNVRGWSRRDIGQTAELGPVPRMRRPLTASDQRDVTKREPSRLLQPAERDLLDQREDVALEDGEVDELAVLFVPLAGLLLAGDVRLGTSSCGGPGRA